MLKDMPNSALASFAFVLFKPKESGNIGAAARALKNMGFADLRLAAAASFDARVAAAMAVHGRDILEAARIVPDLSLALEDRTLSVGTTSRQGPYRARARPLRDIARELVALAATNRIAILFGPEDSGLTNDELKFCQHLVTIPTSAQYPSLNLAQAVMIVAYELLMAAGQARPLAESPKLAPTMEIERMVERLALALIEIGFLPDDNPDHIMLALRALFGRSRLEARELDILNGIAHHIRWFASGGHETIARKRRAGQKLR